MSLITCPGCKCVVDDYFGHCTVCNHKFVNQYAEANKQWREQIENDKKYYDKLNRQRDEYFNNMGTSFSKSYSSNTYSSSSSRYNKKSGKKGNHSTISYIFLGIICGLIINSLALGLIEFIILYIIAVFIFLN